jgi:hypothetical protein
MTPELTDCECCGHKLSTRATTCPRCGDFVAAPRGHERFAWFVTFFFSIGSLFFTGWALLFASGISAPQQCAIITGCIGFTVIPYCYARAVEKF